jgi:hypothetical protein
MTMLAAAVPTAHSQSVFDKLKQKAKDKVNQKEDQATDAAVNSADPTDKTGSTNNDASGSPTAATASAPAETAAAPAEGAAPAAPVTLQSYQNYDFTPGETILFADDFTTTQDGEFSRSVGIDERAGCCE